MNEEDACIFQRAKRDGSLNHSIELVHKAFVTDWKNPKIIAVRALKAEDEARIED